MQAASIAIMCLGVLHMKVAYSEATTTIEASTAIVSAGQDTPDSSTPDAVTSLPTESTMVTTEETTTIPVIETTILATTLPTTTTTTTTTTPAATTTEPTTATTVMSSTTTSQTKTSDSVVTSGHSTASERTIFTSLETSTESLIVCQCNELFWMLLLGVGLGVPLIAFIIALIVTAVKLRRLRKLLPGDSQYLTSIKDDQSKNTADQHRYVIPGSRARSGIESFNDVSCYIDDNEFDDPLYTNQVELTNEDATTTFSNTQAVQSDVQITNVNVDITQEVSSEGDGTEDLYVNKDVLRHLVGAGSSSQRRIQTMDARDTYVNAAAIQGFGVLPPAYIDTEYT